MPRISEIIDCNQATAPQIVPIPFLEAVGTESWEPNKPPRYSYANFPWLTSDPLSFTDANIKAVMAAVETDPLFTVDLSDLPGMQSIRMIMNTDGRRIGLQFPAQGMATQNLGQVPRPSLFNKELIAKLDSRTLAFEVLVPIGPFEGDIVNGVKKYEPAYNPPPNHRIAIRGWYVRGLGGADGERPVFMMLHNFEATPLQTTDATAVAWRQLAYRAAAEGFDVVLYNWRARGVSEGRNARDGAECGRDIFRLLEAFEAGCPTLLAGETQDVVRQLIPDAETMPVVLFGYGDGSSWVGNAMTMNFGPSFNGEANTPRHFNFRGAVMIWSNGGSPYYRSSLLPFFLMNAALMRYKFQSTPETDSSVLEHVGLWPGILLIHGTEDRDYALAGPVEMYNRARGFKAIRTVIGAATQPILAPEELPGTISATLKFARRVVKKEPTMNNTKTTTVVKQVCKALENDDEDVEEED